MKTTAHTRHSMPVRLHFGNLKLAPAYEAVMRDSVEYREKGYE